MGKLANRHSSMPLQAVCQEPATSALAVGLVIVLRPTNSPQLRGKLPR